MTKEVTLAGSLISAEKAYEATMDNREKNRSKTKNMFDLEKDKTDECMVQISSAIQSAISAGDDCCDVDVSNFTMKQVDFDGILQKLTKLNYDVQLDTDIRDRVKGFHIYWDHSE